MWLDNYIPAMWRLPTAPEDSPADGDTRFSRRHLLAAAVLAAVGPVVVGAATSAQAGLDPDSIPREPCAGPTSVYCKPWGVICSNGLLWAIYQCFDKVTGEYCWAKSYLLGYCS